MMSSRTLLSTAAALCALPSALGAWSNLTLEDYQLKQSGYSDFIADLDKVLPIVSVKDVLADTNHANPDSSPEVSNLVSSYTWENVDGYDDVNTLKWYPQGITTTADASESGDYDGDVVHLVSWHSDDYDGGKRGPRISFVNMNDGADRAYRNALLVEPTAGGDTPDFKALDGLHAGGIVWYGDLLYVAWTTGGFRVFDLKHIYQVSIGDGNGLVDGEYQAFNYKYVIPQVRTYDYIPKDGVKGFHFSFASLDRTSNTLVTGEYFKDTTPNRLINFNLDTSTNLLQVNDDGIATASLGVEHEIVKIQGGITINEKYYLTQSGGSLWTFSWLGGEKENADVFPSIPEDLSYQAGYGLWSLMEVPGKRHVVAFDADKF
ncbi:hypothetical protein FQN52_008722 [Onygenales sp. PD_12]|nr:hypothetical protein FQN52_008722 [Onygenales sp. PD_12]